MFKAVMEKLKGVVPFKAAAPTAAQATKPAPKPAKLSASESKELSIVRKSLTTKGPQTLPSGTSCQIDRQSDRQTDRQTESQSDRRQTGHVSQTEGKTIRLKMTDRQTTERRTDQY